MYTQICLYKYILLLEYHSNQQHILLDDDDDDDIIIIMRLKRTANDFHPSRVRLVPPLKEPTSCKVILYSIWVVCVCIFIYRYALLCVCWFENYIMFVHAHRCCIIMFLPQSDNFGSSSSHLILLVPKRIFPSSIPILYTALYTYSSLVFCTLRSVLFAGFLHHQRICALCVYVVCLYIFL